MSTQETTGARAADTPRREYVKPRIQIVPMQEAMGHGGFTPSSNS